MGREPDTAHECPAGRSRRKVPSILLAAALLCVALPVPGCGCAKEPAPPDSEETGAQLESDSFEHNYWSHTELPPMSDIRRLRLAEQDRARGQSYVDENNRKAGEFSDRLEEYIKRWLEGEAPARLPGGLLPEYIDTPKTAGWTLKRPEEVAPDEQWCLIPSHEIDPTFKKCYMLGSDANVTYGKLIFVAPAGARLLVEGDFPHARYMSFEILPPFDPAHPASGTMGETPEVPLVDADIEPDPGHTNPFRVGADRNAEDRHYHVSFDLQTGNASELNPLALKAPEYRAGGNSRVGGPFGFAGPWGGDVLTPSVLWYRVYAPDRGAGVQGGVSLPRALLELDTGERFWLQPDFSVVRERENTRVPAGLETPKEPFDAIGPQLGWNKIFGLALLRMEQRGYIESFGRPRSTERVKERIRRTYLLLFNRGEDAEPPGDCEGSATACKNNNFLTRVFQLGPGKVYVLTGRLPRFPPTRNGEPVMTGGEVRYWSICQYGKGEGDRYETAVNYNALMDDEVVTDENGDYIICYSTRKDRPKNATPKNGVTWMDWGTRSRQTLTIRWMSVIPEWHLPGHAPDAYNLPWPAAAWSGTAYDAGLAGVNRPGVMGPYHPVIHYMTKEEFESLGDGRLSPGAIPPWE